MDNEPPAKRRRGNDGTTRRVVASRGIDNDNDEQDELQSEEEDDDVGSDDHNNNDDDDDQDEDFDAPKATTTRSKGAGAKRKGATNGKRATSTRRTQRARRTATRNDNDNDDDVLNDAEGQAAKTGRNRDDFSVQADNGLFNAVKDAKSALQATADDWMELYQADEDSRGQALAEMINFMFRCCGCNASVDLHEAQDLDGVVDKLQDIQSDFSKVHQALYPLVSKSKAYKQFYASLAEFLRRLAGSAHDSEVLYDDIFCETLQSWLVAASSSKLRAFRHTTTVLTLLLVEGICAIATQVADDFASLQRQKEAEVKRSARVKTNQDRLKELEARVKATHVKKTRIETYFRQMLDAVFVHRCRDADPGIRMECIRSLGTWMKLHPRYFLEGSYLRYIGWTLTDQDKDVRHEAVSALLPLYGSEEYINSLQHFTERFKDRLVEMAAAESELSVRIAAIGVLRAIDKHGLLEDDQRNKVGQLLYNAEPRVRKAVAGFCADLLEERFEERKTQLNADAISATASSSSSTNDRVPSAWEREEAQELQKRRLRYKCLANLLVTLAKSLDQTSESDEDNDDNDFAEQAASWSLHTAMATQSEQKDRVSLAVESLWLDVAAVTEWEHILDYALLDHSSSAQTAAASPIRSRARSDRSRSRSAAIEDLDEDLAATVTSRAASATAVIEESCRLTDAEDRILLNVLVASIRYTRHRASLLSSKEEQQKSDIYSSITRALMQALPRFFAKYRTDVQRSMLLLLLPQQMQLGLYLDMRQLSAYESLWDIVTRQFLAARDTALLQRSMETLDVFVATKELSGINSAKQSALEAAILAPLKEIATEVEIEHNHLEPEQRDKLTGAITRLVLLSRYNDCSSLLEEETDRNRPNSAIHIAMGVLERGSLGMQEDDQMVERALELLYLYLLWQTATAPMDEETPANVFEIRDSVIEKTTEIAIGEDSGYSISIRRNAFKTLLELCIAGKHRHAATGHQRDLIELSVQMQYRCAGFLETEVSRYAASTTDQQDKDDLVREQDDEDDEEDANEDDRRKKADGTDKDGSYRPKTLTQHNEQYAFNEMVSTFSRAICTEVLDLFHASTILAHYDRFNAFYDESCKILAEALRLYGVLGEHGHIAATVVIASLKTALSYYLRHSKPSDIQFNALSRLLSNHSVVRAKGFTISARLSEPDLLKIHIDCISHVAGKMSIFSAQGKMTSMRRMLTMFRGLTLFTIGMTGREAAKVHSHLVKTFEEKNIDTNGTAKAWDAHRTYEKKLVSLMAKDNTVRTAARKQIKATAVGEAQDDQNGQEGEKDELAASQEAVAAAKKRMRGRGSGAGNAQANKKRRVEDSVDPIADVATLPMRRSNRVTGLAGNIPSYVDSGRSSDVDQDGDDLFVRPRKPATRVREVRAQTQQLSASNDRLLPKSRPTAASSTSSLPDGDPVSTASGSQQSLPARRRPATASSTSSLPTGGPLSSQSGSQRSRREASYESMPSGPPVSTSASAASRNGDDAIAEDNDENESLLEFPESPPDYPSQWPDD